MRLVVATSCALLLSSCAGGTDAALTAQDAKSKLAVKDRAVSQLATTELAVIVQQAQSWAAGHAGSMAGFAVDLQDTQPSVASTAKVLTDLSVSVAVGDGRCLTANLPAGASVVVSC